MECITHIILIMIIADTALSSCVWNINKDLPRNDPIYYKTGKDGALLIIPKSNRGLELFDNEIISLSCWGGKNKIKQIGHERVKAKCIKNNKLLVEGRESNIKNLDCNSSVSANVVMTDRTCARGKGKFIRVGYNSFDDEWLDLYHSCYDEQNITPIYSQHVVHGAALGGYFKGYNRKNFRLAGITSRHSISKAFTKKNQMEIFQTLFGKNDARQYIDDESFLARGHLAPDADFILNSWQQGTYLYSNVMPQWQSLNRGNWFKLESLIRRTSQTNRDDLIVITGALGVLSRFRTSENQKTEIYLLPDKKLPVPEFTFKIVYSESRQKGIGFFMLNNPFAESLYRSFCESICKEFGWWQADWDTFSKGHIHCCNVNTAFSAIEIDPLFNASGVMSL